MKNPPKKKKSKLRQEFDATFKGLRWKDVRGASRETLKDLRQPKEIFTLVAAIVVPGGFIAYPAYRLRKYRKGQTPPANDDTPPGPYS